MQDFSIKRDAASGGGVGGDGGVAPLWSGCHASFSEVSCNANAYDSERWVASVAERTARWQRALVAAKGFPPESDRPSFLPTLLGAFGGSRVSVLDIGGGGANAYFHARAAVKVQELQWTVVERPAVCEAVGRCAVPAEVQFLSSFPSSLFDVVFFGSSIQYFEDWREAICAAARVSARFLLLEDVPLVRSPTFAAAQRYFDGVIPAWFLNHEELLDVAAQAGLRLAAWDRYRASILGRWDGFPMDNYPSEMRVGLPSSLLFRINR